MNEPTPLDLPAIKARMEKATKERVAAKDWAEWAANNGLGFVAREMLIGFAFSILEAELKPLRTDLQLLVQEVERLQIQHGTCSVCGYVAWRERDRDTQHCMFCELQSSLLAKDKEIAHLTNGLDGARDSLKIYLLMEKDYQRLRAALRARDEALRKLAKTANHSHACYDPPERSCGIAPLKRACAEDCEIRIINAALSDAGKEGK
jgi:hypothetical protein